MKSRIIVLFLFLFVFLIGCEEEKQLTVTWLNTDGSLIETTEAKYDFDPNQKTLPQDTNEWHYTGWMISRSGNVVVCTATRVPKIKVIWQDFDGSILHEEYIIDGDEIKEKTLPESNEKWNYTEWSVETDNISDTKTYTAERSPNETYFQGNVFQIIVKDSKGEPLSSGSGFILNDNGYFITNYHVMDECYSATAFFDIKDYDEGRQYTQLDIEGWVYASEDKDIFIGKLKGYDKIKDHYRSINFTENYEKDEIAYTFGYPNSSIKMEINSGVILEEYSNIYDKINGVYYILSDSYIAPGSSGGILTNENFEVIGITTIGLYEDASNKVYTAGGSIPFFVFKSNLDNIDNKEIKTLKTMP